METKVIFRQKGERKEFEFDGGFYISVNNGEKIIHLGEMPSVIDLTNIPVVTIAGKKGKVRDARLAEFKKNAPDFKGAILLLPYSWANGWNDGILMIPSEALLNSSQKISGGKPEISLNNLRFLSDGRYVADQVRLLHGKVIETLTTEVEQEVEIEKLAEMLVKRFSNLKTSLYFLVQEVIKKLNELEDLRVLRIEGDKKNIEEIVQIFLVAKFKELGVKKFSDISENFSITAEAVIPDLIAEESILGKILIPGVGEKNLLKRWKETFYGNFAMVELSFNEMRKVTHWPYIDVAFEVTEITHLSYQGYERDHMKSDTLRGLLSYNEEGRWQKILEYFQERWIKVQRDRNYPKDEQTVDAHLFDLPTDLKPFNWGYNFMTGEKFYAYPAIDHILYAPKGYFIDKGWWIKWLDSAEEAERSDFNSREEAKSYARSREISATLTSTETTPFPFDIPEKYQEEVLPQEYIMSLTGLDPDLYIIEDKIGSWYRSGEDSYRDYDGKMQCGSDPWGSCVKKYDDGKLHIGQDAFKNLFESFVVKFEIHRSNIWSPGFFKALGLSDEKIAEIKNVLEEREALRKNKYEKREEDLKWEIVNSKEFSFIPKTLQNKVYNFYPLSFYLLREELESAWSQASALLKNQNILVNFGGHFRMMGAANNEDYYVVSYDGLIRQADSISYRKAYRSEGEKLWDFVGETETALYYNQYEGLKVVKEPIKYTELQNKSIEQIKFDLFGEIVYETTTESEDEEVVSEPEVEEESDREITLEDLKKLQAKFGG